MMEQDKRGIEQRKEYHCKEPLLVKHQNKQATKHCVDVVKTQQSEKQQETKRMSTMASSQLMITC